MTDKDLFWLIGLLEGEGTFLAPSPSAPGRPRIAVHMTDRDTIEKVASLLGGIGVGHIDLTKRCPKWKKSYRVTLTGKRAVDLMLKIKPFMSARRQIQIERATHGYVYPPRRLANADYQAILRRFRSGEAARNLASIYKIRRESIYKIIRRYRAA